MSRTKKVKVRCPKCGEEFEVKVQVKEAIRYAPTRQRPIHGVEYVLASPEAAKLWEKRKKQIGLEQ